MSAWDDRLLFEVQQMMELGLTAEDIAANIGRTAIAVASKVRRTPHLAAIGLKKPEQDAASSNTWPPERIEIVKQGLLDGLSASQIAARVGNGCTRNAIIGIVGRRKELKEIGFARQAPAKLARQEWRKVSSKKPRNAPKPAPVEAPSLDMWKPKPQPIIPDTEQPAMMLSIEDLTERTCKWPIGDPGTESFGFCGNEKALDAGPYCLAHMRLAYIAPPARERKRRWR